MAGPVKSPFGRPWTLAVLFVLLASAGLTVILQVPPDWVPAVRQIVPMLQSASFVVVIAVGGLALSRWYLTSDAPSLWIGVALMIYGVARLLTAELLPQLLAPTAVDPLIAVLRPAAQVVVTLLLAWAVTIAPVSARITAPRLFSGSVLLLLVVAIVLRLLPAVATAIDGAAATGARTYDSVNELGVTPVVLSLLAVAFTVQGWRRRRWLFTWLALLLVCSAIGNLIRVVAPPPVAAGLLGQEVMRLLGLVLALNGATREILYTYRDSSTRAARSEFTAMTAQERIRQGQAAAEERAHEARSALAAIEGATRTLEHYRDRLPPETQEALSAAVSGEIRRLQRLVSVEASEADVGPFSLAESLAPIVASEHARGVTVDLEVAGHLNVVGRAAATEQVLQALFDNGRRYAPGSALTVRAEPDDEWVILRVEDRGPGVPPEQREAIFRRGVRGGDTADVAGSGLGLYVAARLMHEQGGELWVDERRGGGASFALALRAANASEQADVAGHGLDKGSEVGDSRGFSSVRRGD